MKSSSSSRRKADPRTRFALFSTGANLPVELSFTARGAYVDAFNEVVLDAIFTDPSGDVRRVPAFWAGGRIWKVRYASPLAGEHPYRTVCSSTTDAGLHDMTGAVTVTPYRGKNPLYVHGPVQIAADKRHFEHADGTPFFWLGDTWWMGLCHRLDWPQGFKKLTADRKKKGFNVVQIVTGLYPDMYPFDPRGANEAGYPWEEGYSQIRPEYFDAADRKLGHLVEQGITPCIVAAWGFYLSWMTEDQLKAHWRYLIARYGAWPVIWCAAGEANVPWYLAKDYPCDDRALARGWTNIMRTMRETDPFHRPVTIHPGAIKRFTARSVTDDETLLDFDMLQCIHQENESVDRAITAVRETYAATPRMPVINGEPCYEMLGGIITAPWPRRAFWSCVLNGAMGHTYGCNGIWQCNQPGMPHGISPNGYNHGSAPWQETMHYSGSSECAHGKNLLARFAWEKFEPHPEWAAYTHDVWLPLDGAKWIWSSRENPPADAPPVRRYFRRTFELPAGKKIVCARLRFAGTTYCEAQLNRVPAAFGWECRTGPQFNDCAALLQPGRNSLTLWCENRQPTGVTRGLLACLEIRFTDGKVQRIVTDGTWKTWEHKIGGWATCGFDDTAWPAALVVGLLGDQPWGPITPQSMDLQGPQSAGIPGETRVIYVPYVEPIVVRDLGAGTRHHALHFDPVSGREKKLGPITADTKGAWNCAAPAGIDHDWVLVLEAKP